jgi:hypothetical protein
MKTLKYISIIAGFAFAFSSCGGGDKLEDTETVDSTKSTQSSGPEISEEILGDLITSIPTPLEMSASIKESGAKYDQNILNDVDNIDKYKTSYKQAFNLGVYGANLAYINIYEKTLSSLEYLNAMRILSDNLKIGQFFDFNSMKRFAGSDANIDSLIYASTLAFNNMDGELRKQKRGNLSVLMITGAWLEGLHVATQITKTNKNKTIEDKIGEQKMVLDNLFVILEMFKDETYFTEVTAGVQEIKNEFDKVKIEYVYKEPESKIVNGRLVIVDNSTSEVKMTPENLKAIIAVTDKVRNKLIAL